MSNFCIAFQASGSSQRPGGSLMILKQNGEYSLVGVASNVLGNGKRVFSRISSESMYTKINYFPTKIFM